MLNSNGNKPRGMQWTTYQRLKSRHDALVEVSFYDIGLKLDFLHKLRRGESTSQHGHCLKSSRTLITPMRSKSTWKISR